MSMGLLLKRGRRDFKPCVAQGETAREAEMPLRFQFDTAGHRVEVDEGATLMRSAVAIALIVGALSISSGLVSATPLALSDHAALSRDMSAAASRASPRLCPPLQALRQCAAPLQLQYYP
jgi:hypothetical protein